MKVVLDTNVFISGLMLPYSKAGIILKAWHQSKVEVVTSDYLLGEIKRVLTYPKIAKRLNWSESKANQFIELLNLFTTSVDISATQAIVTRDCNDNAILATYIASHADYLVTGDDDLLSMKQQYAIITVNEFVEKLTV